MLAAAAELAVDGGAAAIVAAAVWAVAAAVRHLVATLDTMRKELIEENIERARERRDGKEHRERACTHFRRMERYAKVQAVLAQERYRKMTGSRDPIFEDTQPIPVSPSTLQLLSELGEDG